MNISGKDLKDKFLYSKKKLFYKKLSSSYQKAYKIYSSKSNQNKHSGYKNKVLKWFFNLSLENRKVICSVENKLFTKLLHQGYLEHRKSENVSLKFKMNEEKETIEQEQRDRRDDIPQYYGERVYFNKFGNYTIHEEILNEIMFYQCESPVSDYNSYSSYFTLSNKILDDQELFLHFFDKISGKQCFQFPIKTVREEETKNSIFQLPDWINPDKYYLLSEHIVGLFEQSISIKYILSLNGKDAIDEVLNANYLNDLMKRQNYLEEFIKQYIYEELYFKFEIKEIIDRIYKLNQNPKECEKKMPKSSMANPAVFGEQNTEENTYESIHSKIVNFKMFNNPYNEFSNYVTFITFTELFGREDLLRRMIFERILERYQEKEVDSIDIEKEHSKKKKKKKKKKKTEENDNNKNNNIEHNNTNEIIDNNNEKANLIKMVIDDIVEMAWKVINDNINTKKEDNNIDIENGCNKNNKKNKKVKEKKFFLYNTVKTTKIKEHQHINQEKSQHKTKGVVNTVSKPSLSPEKTIAPLKDTSNNNSVLSNTQPSDQDDQQLNNINTSSSDMNNNTINNNIKNKFNPSYTNKIPKRQQMLISSTTNSITISSSCNQTTHLPLFPLNNTKTIIGSDINLIQYPSNSLIDTLNRDMDLFLQEEDQFLKLLHKAKVLIRDYLSQITSKIYPESTLQIYGSTLFELDIESSDLDLSIVTFINYSLEKLSLHLISSPLYSTIFDSITPVLSATVPVIKLVIDPLKLNIPSLTSIYSQIHSSAYYKTYIFNLKEIDLVRVDITLNSINLNQIQFTNTVLSNFRDMIPIIKIMKRLLQLKKLNLTYEGGMSSYCLLILVFTCAKVSLYARSNKGMLFMEFLKKIGMLVDFHHTIINPNLSNPFLTYFNIDSVPSILDPVTNNNLGKSLFKIFDIVALIKKVHELLFEINKTIEVVNNKSYIQGKGTNIIKEVFKKIVEDYL